MRPLRFVTLLVGLAIAWPLPMWAQQSGEIHRVGVLIGLSEKDVQGRSRVAAFRKGLQELGWKEGRDVEIHVRWSSGTNTGARAAAAELVGLAPNVILGSSTPPIRALKEATKTIPIVFAGVANPISAGFVKSLSKPGGNITGFTSFEPGIASKWLQFLKETSPNLKRVTVIYNPKTAPHSIFWPVFEKTALSLGLNLVRDGQRNSSEIERVISALAGDEEAGLVLLPDIFTARHRVLIHALAARHRVVAVSPIGYHAFAGGLMSYGPDFVDQHRQAASYIDRILKGEIPANLPVQMPTKFELIANLKVAKALGITLPPSIMLSADEVIE